MPESIELKNFDEVDFEELQAPRRIKLRPESFSIEIKKFQDFLRDIKDKVVENIERSQDKQDVAADIIVTRLAPVSERINRLVDLLDINGSRLGLKVSNKAIKIKDKMKYGMYQNMALAKALTEDSNAQIKEEQIEKQNSSDSSEIRVSKNESSVARIEKYATEEVETKEVAVKVTPTYEQEEASEHTPVVEESRPEEQPQVRIEETTQDEKEDTAEPVVAPTQVEENAAISVAEVAFKKGYTSFKMESTDIDNLVRECARKKEESASIAAEKLRAEQAAIEAEQACLRARQELQDKYRELKERTRLLEEQNRREQAEIKALQDQKAQYQNSTQSFVSSIDTLDAMLSETARPEPEIRRTKAA